MKGRVLVTGGTGFIGSHTCVELLQGGYEVVIVDNLANSTVDVIDRLEEITGKRPPFHHVDLLDKDGLREVFRSYKFSAVIHFAALKAVGESVEKPLYYYQNNVTGSIHLLQCMKDAGVHRFVFSSSATVYGESQEVPFREELPLQATNPYGRTKIIMEDMCRDVAQSDPQWKMALLRYFNPVGAHESGLIGEEPQGVPNNLLPYLMQVAVGVRHSLKVFGSDYSTRDGTAIRDYIHVVDLAKGHLAALNAIDDLIGCEAINLGTGEGSTVLEVIRAASEAIGKDVPFEIVPRRPGDVAQSYCDPSKAKRLFQWSAERSLLDACKDAWKWQQKITALRSK